MKRGGCRIGHLGAVNCQKVGAVVLQLVPSPRGRHQIHWLQPPYSAAGCSQLRQKKLYTTIKYCIILAAASFYGF